MSIDIDELTEFFDFRTIERGVGYVIEQRVESLERQQSGLRLLAQVRGRGRKRYRVLVNIERQGDRLSAVRGQCSCPVHFNCKHVVATLLWDSLQNAGGNPEDETPDEDRAIDAWLERVESSARARPLSNQDSDQLRYVLDQPAGGGLRVDVVRTHRLKNGALAKGRPFDSGAQSQARVVTPSDRAILGLLASSSDGLGSKRSGFVLRPGVDAGALLGLLLGSGRAHWRSHRDAPLRLGEPRKQGLAWRLDEHGRYRVRLDRVEEDVRLLPIAPPWYLDVPAGLCGPLDSGLAPEAAAALASAPPLRPEQCARARQVLARLPGLPLPEADALETLSGIEPVPRLRLYSRDEPWIDEQWKDLLDLTFLYDDIEITPMNDDASVVVGDRLVERDIEAEETHFGPLMVAGFDEAPGFIPVESGLVPLRLFNALGADGWIAFVLREAPHLREQGWRIEIDPSFRYRFAEVDGWYAELDETEGNDWFDLELGIEIDGERFSLLPTLVRFVADLRKDKTLRDFLKDDSQQPMVMRMEDGQLVELPREKLRHVIETLAELYDPGQLDGGSLRMSRYQAGVLHDLDDGELAWGGAEGPKRFAEKLAGFSRIKQVAPPGGLKAELRPYQQEGLNWLQFLREYELGGILADDMGLGKTIQTLAHLLLEKESGRADRPSLVVAPTSLMVNWRREAGRFTPGLKVLVLHGPERASRFDAIAEHDLVLTTYPLLPRDADALRAQPWHMLVLDEAQNIKNPRAKAAEVVRSLDARHRLCLTGTPLENHLGELWSQFHFLMPGLLGDEKTFRRLFRKPIEKQGDRLRQQQLQRRIAPFLLRREKAEVVTDLPRKTEIISEVELEGAQRDLYETIRVAMNEKVRREIDKKGIERSQIVILDALLKLRQVCCDPRLLKMDAAKKVRQSAKLEQLMAMLPEMIEEGRRALLFSQFTSMLKLIENAVGKHKIPYVKLTGQTRDRETPVDRFQSGEAPLFLISLKAGGAGLNLTAADTVIHYDPWWNPAVERQATDRAHRIGQDKAVFVYKFVTRGTVEEKIAAMQQHKQALADALFGDGKQAARLGEDDLQALFEPLA